MDYERKYLKYKSKNLEQSWPALVENVPRMKKGDEVTEKQYMTLPHYFKVLFVESGVGGKYVKVCDGVRFSSTKRLEPYQYRSLPLDMKFGFREEMDELGEMMYVWDGNVDLNKKYRDCLLDRLRRAEVGTEISHDMYMDLPDDVRDLFRMHDDRLTNGKPEMWVYARFVKK